MNREFRNNRNRGFTIVEILVVIAIITILTMVMIPRFLAYQEHSQKSVCASNRQMLVRQILYEQAIDPSYREADADAFLTGSTAHCPSNGTYTLHMEDASVTITCTKHKAESGGSGENTPPVSGDLLTNFWDYIKNYNGPYLSNSMLRQEFFKANGNQWPTITVDGKTFYIQPFYKTQSTETNVEDKVWLFARTDNSSADGWSANLVYDIIDQKWYCTTNYKGETDLSKAADINRYNSVEELHDAVLNQTKAGGVPVWVEVSNYTESPGTWNPKN